MNQSIHRLSKKFDFSSSFSQSNEIKNKNRMKFQNQDKIFKTWFTTNDTSMSRSNHSIIHTHTTMSMIRVMMRTIQRLGVVIRVVSLAMLVSFIASLMTIQLVDATATEKSFSVDPKTTLLSTPTSSTLFSSTNTMLKQQPLQETKNDNVLKKKSISNSAFVDEDYTYHHPINLNVKVSIHRKYNSKCHMDAYSLSQSLIMMEGLDKEEGEKEQKQKENPQWSVTVFTLEEITMMKKRITHEDYLFYESRPLSFSTLPSPIPSIHNNSQNNSVESKLTDNDSYSSKEDNRYNRSDSKYHSVTDLDVHVDNPITVGSTVQFQIPKQKRSILHHQHQHQKQHQFQSHPNKLILFIELSKLSLQNQKKNQVIINRTMKTIKRNDHDVKLHPLVVQVQYDHEESINLDHYCNGTNVLVPGSRDINTDKKRHRDDTEGRFVCKNVLKND